MLSFCQEAKDDANSPPDLAEVPVEAGNRKQGMLQAFPSCQPKTCHDRISNADFAVCPLTGYQFPWAIFERSKFEEIVASGIEGL